jgi:hypothetical protein
LTARVERVSPRAQEDGKKRILQRPAEKELAGAANIKENRATTAFEGEKVTKQLLPDVERIAKEKAEANAKQLPVRGDGTRPILVNYLKS